LSYRDLKLAEVRCGGSESGTVPYPYWSTFPNFYSHAGDIQVEESKLLKHIAILTENTGCQPYQMRPYAATMVGHEWFWELADEAHIYPL